MKILMSARWPIGGIRSFLRYAYAGPAFSDCSFTLVAPGEDLFDSMEPMFPKGSLRVIQVEPSNSALGRGIYEEIRRFRYDLLHSHGLTASVATEFARFPRRVPHLATVHDVFLPELFFGVRGRLKRMLIARMFKSIDAVHAVSHDCANNFLEYLPSYESRRVHTIPHGIDVRRFAEAKAIDVRRHCGLPSNSAVIGFFGRFMAPKGFRTLVDAVSILEKMGLERPIRVITFGWGGFIREDFQYVDELGLSDCFVRQEHTDQPERWMKGVDIVAMPSIWEACGLVGMEALCAGVPIVGTSCIGLREVLAGSPARMIPVRDSEALARALRQEIVSPRTHEFSTYSQCAEERFSSNRSVGEIRQLYGKLCSSN